MKLRIGGKTWFVAEKLHFLLKRSLSERKTPLISVQLHSLNFFRKTHKKEHSNMFIRQSNKPNERVQAERTKLGERTRVCIALD